MIINKSLVAGPRCGGWAGRGPSPLDTLPAARTLHSANILCSSRHRYKRPRHLSSHQEIANCSCSILHQRYGGEMVVFSLPAPSTLHLPSLLHHVLTARAGLRSAVTLIFTQHYISSSTCKLLVLPAWMQWMHSPAPFCLLNFVCTNIRTKCKILWGSVMPLG